ncbi:AhpC/TSA family protein [Pikeienuella piscinae]|uniref:AhpC/TSA family protein n=1 Tax=Pikeienuella piscinae TaxID=2748098 RepID=A0A7L5BXD6_9RHOB|nr:peroxiredoxin-like family protein [Pikeienuella piscinae]QIE55508.1 AhpC/TSA family protein [Pikeienuella piscinae]
MLIPRKPTPDLSLDLHGGGTFTLSKETSQRGTLLCFYRGLHCPICATYLGELAKLVPEFEARGVGVVAISCDTAERARGMADKLASPLRVAYGLPLAEAKDWGLYLSTSRGKTSTGLDEPALFAEPGLFMTGPNRALYFGSVQTMPFVRPHFPELLKMLDHAIAKNYPARGEYVGPV